MSSRAEGGGGCLRTSTAQNAGFQSSKALKTSLLTFSPTGKIVNPYNLQVMRHVFSALADFLTRFAHNASLAVMGHGSPKRAL